MNKLINSRSVAIWIDGSCKGNDKTKVSPGGWAALLIDNETKKEKTLSGGKDSTTNNEMELESLHQALIALKQEELLHIHAVIYTDSQYVIGLFDPIKPWKATSHAEKVREMRKLFETKVKSYAFVKIKGHSGIKENEYVDAIASGEAEKRKVPVIAKVELNPNDPYFKALDEGYEAGNARKLSSTNPYNKDTEKSLHTAWMEGWLEANADYEL